MATLAVTGRSDLTDGQWAVLAPLLPVGRRPGRPPKWSKRQLIDGIRWRIRAGTPWRDVPPVYGPWQTVYGLFRRWQRAGVWQQILTALQALADTDGQIVWDVSVDSTIMRAHQHSRRLTLDQAIAPATMPAAAPSLGIRMLMASARSTPGRPSDLRALGERASIRWFYGLRGLVPHRGSLSCGSVNTTTCSMVVGRGPPDVVIWSWYRIPDSL